MTDPLHSPESAPVDPTPEPTPRERRRSAIGLGWILTILGGLILAIILVNVLTPAGGWMFWTVALILFFLLAIFFTAPVWTAAIINKGEKAARDGR